MYRLTLSLYSLFIVLAAVPAISFGVCAVNDVDFSTEDGGCKDVSTGIVWASEGLGLHSWLDAEDYCVELGENSEGQGYTDWRLPTVREADIAKANGLNSHLDFQYDAGNQGPEDKFLFTGCRFVKRFTYQWMYNYVTGSFEKNGGGTHGNVGGLCVRGPAPDYENDCPDRKGNLSGGGGDEGGSGGGGGKGKK